jgi:hypothetical protein
MRDEFSAEALAEWDGDGDGDAAIPATGYSWRDKSEGAFLCVSLRNAETQDALTWTAADPCVVLRSHRGCAGLPHPIKSARGPSKRPGHYAPPCSDANELGIQLREFFPECLAILARPGATVTRSGDLTWVVSVNQTPRVFFLGARFACVLRHAVWLDDSSQKKERVVVWAFNEVFTFE